MVKGYGDGTLRPDETITAAQIAKVVDRLYPDGATRAEVANFLAAGSIGVLQKKPGGGSQPRQPHGYRVEPW